LLHAGRRDHHPQTGGARPLDRDAQAHELHEVELHLPQPQLRSHQKRRLDLLERAQERNELRLARRASRSKRRGGLRRPLSPGHVARRPPPPPPGNRVPPPPPPPPPPPGATPPP